MIILIWLFCMQSYSWEWVYACTCTDKFWKLSIVSTAEHTCSEYILILTLPHTCTYPYSWEWICSQTPLWKLVFGVHAIFSFTFRTENQHLLSNRNTTSVLILMILYSHKTFSSSRERSNKYTELCKCFTSFTRVLECSPFLSLLFPTYIFFSPLPYLHFFSPLPYLHFSFLPLLLIPLPFHLILSPHIIQCSPHSADLFKSLQIPFVHWSLPSNSFTGYYFIPSFTASALCFNLISHSNCFLRCFPYLTYQPSTFEEDFSRIKQMLLIPFRL